MALPVPLTRYRAESDASDGLGRARGRRLRQQAEGDFGHVSIDESLSGLALGEVPRPGRTHLFAGVGLRDDVVPSQTT